MTLPALRQGLRAGVPWVMLLVGISLSYGVFRLVTRDSEADDDSYWSLNMVTAVLFQVCSLVLLLALWLRLRQIKRDGRVSSLDPALDACLGVLHVTIIVSATLMAVSDPPIEVLMVLGLVIVLVMWIAIITSSIISPRVPPPSVES